MKGFMEKKDDNDEGKINIMFFGNPGVGKSTLVNSFLYQSKSQQAPCKSGYSPNGVGVTCKRRIINIESSNEVVIDSPGLADIDMAKKACKEIEESLRRKGTYKLVFVCNLTAGRVRPEDVVTINRVLGAVKLESIPYTLVINKLSKRGMKVIIANPNAFDKFNEVLQHKPTDAILVLTDSDAVDAEDELIEDPICCSGTEAVQLGKAKMVNFKKLITQTEGIVIGKERVLEIVYEDFRAEVEALKKELVTKDKQIAALCKQTDQAQEEVKEAMKNAKKAVEDAEKLEKTMMKNAKKAVEDAEKLEKTMKNLSAKVEKMKDEEKGEKFTCSIS